MRTALYYGTFDPVTNGHLWPVARSLALDLFDGIVVGVVNDPARATLFPIDERVRLWRENAEAVNERRIEVVAIDEEPPVRAAKRLRCRFILRSIRTVWEYEAQVASQRANHALEPIIQTVFLMPDDEIAAVSSGLVRDMIGKAGWHEAVKRYVPVATWEALVRKVGGSGVSK